MKNFVFDLYGTLVDIRTDESSAEFKRAFLEKYGEIFGENFFGGYEGAFGTADCGGEYREPDVREVFRALAAERGVELNVGQINEVAKDFRLLSLRKLEVYPHVPEMLEKLRLSGAKLFILSNAQSSFTMPELEKLGIDKYFDGIELSSDFGYKKPSAEFFGHIIDKYGLEREQTVYTGNDIEADIVGAKRAGLTAVYIKTEISPPTDRVSIARKIADFVADGHKNLAKILLSL